MRHLCPSSHARRPALALAAALLAAGACSPGPAAPDGPPIRLLVICIDTLRADHVGTYGYPRDTTPNLDALAERGIWLEDAWAHAPWTVPATASLLTGRYPSQHGAMVPGAVKHLGHATPSQIARGVETLAERLAAADVRSGLFSANPYLYGSFQRGFDEVAVERVDGATLSERAMAFIRQQAGGSFFAYLQYMDLHQPLRPPQPFFDFFPVYPGGGHAERHAEWSYGDLRADPGPDFEVYRDHKIALYDGALRYVDHEIGRLVALLDELGLRDSTVVLVTSDHGEELWDHWRVEGSWGDDPRGIWGVGHGHSMFQELLRVPLILAGPGVPAGRRSACPVRHIDILPTLTDLLELPAADGLPGASLLPLFASPTGAERCDSRPQIAESPAYGPDSRAIAWRGRKLILRAGKGGGEGGSEGGSEGDASGGDFSGAAVDRLLYDLRDDPGEQRDLAAEPPAPAETLAALAALLESELGRTPGIAGEPMQLDDESLRALHALGYL